MFMKTFNLAVSRKKRNNHIVNIVILTALYFMGFWLGKHYFQRYSPYTVAYAIPSLVVGLVVLQTLFRQGTRISSPTHKKQGDCLQLW